MPPAMLWNRLRDGGDKAGFARASARMFAARAQADRILKAHPELVESSARFAQSGITISREGTTRDLRTWRVSTNFFDVLGIKPYLGRFFHAGENDAGDAGDAGDAQYAVVSYRLWRQLTA